MKLLEGKKALIFGIANNRSIAWAVAQAFSNAGAEVGISYAGEILKRRVDPLAESIGCDFVEECDVSKDEDINAIAEKAKDRFGKIDILVHSIGFADRNELRGPFYNTSRKGFHLAMDISVYSFIGLARAFQPLMNEGGSLLTMTYHGSNKVTPNYNVMGIAKAALEASTRYLAFDFGKQKIRVNAVSAGPIRTLAAMGVGDFKTMYKAFEAMAPLHENVTTQDVANAALFLCSDMSARTTGEVLYVDSGYNIMGVPETIDE